MSKHSQRVQVLKTAGTLKRNGKRLNWQVAKSWKVAGMPGSYSESAYFHTEAEARSYAAKVQIEINNYAAP